MNTLEKAAAIMKRDGFTRGAREDDMGRHCLLGAINKAGEEGDYGEATRFLATILRKKIPKDGIVDTFNDRLRVFPNDGDCQSVLAAWNNMICSGKNEAVDVLKRAATLFSKRSRRVTIVESK